MPALVMRSCKAWCLSCGYVRASSDGLAVARHPQHVPFMVRCPPRSSGRPPWRAASAAAVCVNTVVDLRALHAGDKVRQFNQVCRQFCGRCSVRTQVGKIIERSLLLQSDLAQTFKQARYCCTEKLRGLRGERGSRQPHPRPLCGPTLPLSGPFRGEGAERPNQTLRCPSHELHHPPKHLAALR